MHGLQPGMDPHQPVTRAGSQDSTE